MKIKPFYERVMDGLVSRYYEHLTGEKSSTLTAAGSYISLRAPQAKYMFDNDLTTYYHSGQAQRTDDFVAADMGIVREVREIRIIQGRNSVDDVDYFDNVIVEYSADGEEWIALTEPMEGVYDILWKGEPFMARYVGIRKLESTKRNWLAIRSFDINPVEKCDYGWDANPFTSFSATESLDIAVAEGTTSLRLLLGSLPTEGIAYELVDSSNNTLAEGTILSPEQTIEVAEGSTILRLKGAVTLYEVIAK
jgi:hyaluronoglucosaminidase